MLKAEDKLQGVVSISYLCLRLYSLSDIFVFSEVYGNDFGLHRVLFLNLLGDSVQLVLAATDQHNIHSLLGQVQTESFA